MSSEEINAVSLAKSYLAGGESPPLRGDTTPQIARALIALDEKYEALLGLRNRQSHHITSLVMQLRGHDWHAEVVYLRSIAFQHLAQIEQLKSQFARAGAAARVYAERVTALGLAADDNDPKVMATAEPVGAAQADLYAALGLLVRDAAGTVSVTPPDETLDQLRAERDTARMLAEVRGEVCESLRAELEGLRSHPFSDVIEKETAEAIATWLDDWSPTVGETRKLICEAAKDSNLILFTTSSDADYIGTTDISFDNTCLAIVAALCSGAWRQESP